MNPTPLERFWANAYLAGLISTGVSIIGLFLYIIGGVVLRTTDIFPISYPILDWNQDPILWFLFAGVGLFVSITMVGRIFSVLLAPASDEDEILFVLLGSIVIGFGMSAVYHSVGMIVKIVGWPAESGVSPISARFIPGPVVSLGMNRWSSSG